MSDSNSPDIGLPLHTIEPHYVIVLGPLEMQEEMYNGRLGYRVYNTRTWICEGEFLQEFLALQQAYMANARLKELLEGAPVEWPEPPLEDGPFH